MHGCQTGESHETDLEADSGFGDSCTDARDLDHLGLRARNRRAARRLHARRISPLQLGNPERRPHHRLPQAAEAEPEQALPGGDEFADRRRGPLDRNRRPVRRNDHEEAIMNILLWYLPYAMFSGACDVVLSESETRTDGKW